MKLTFCIFISIFNYQLSFSQIDSNLRRIEQLPFGYSPELVFNKESDFYGLMGFRNTVALFDNNVNQYYFGSADFILNSIKRNYEDKIYFILYNTENSKCGLYLTAIMDKEGIADTSLTIFEYKLYDELKLTDRSNFSIRMNTYSGPNDSSFAFIYDNEYKKNIKEGFKLRVLKDSQISDIIEVEFDYLDDYTTLGKLYFDGTNIYTFMYIYNEKHNNKNYPSKFAIIKFNTETKKTITKEFSFDYFTVRNLDLSGYHNDVFVLNAFVDENEGGYEYKKVKLLRLNENLIVEDSIVVDKDVIDNLNFKEVNKYNELKKWRVENKILPEVDNSFPDYQINFYFKKIGILFDGSPGIFDDHLISPPDLAGLVGEGLIRGLLRDSETHYSCNNLIISREKMVHTFNDTIYSSNYCLIQYSFLSEEDGLTLYSNIRNKSDKGYRKYLIDEHVSRIDTYTDWQYCFGQLISRKEKGYKVIPVNKNMKPVLLLLTN